MPHNNHPDSPLHLALQAAHGPEAWRVMSRNDRANAVLTLRAYLRALSSLPSLALAPHSPTPAAFAAALLSLAEA